MSDRVVDKSELETLISFLDQDDEFCRKLRQAYIELYASRINGGVSLPDRRSESQLAYYHGSEGS